MNKVILKDIGFIIVIDTNDIKDPMYKKLSNFSKTRSLFLTTNNDDSNELFDYFNKNNLLDDVHFNKDENKFLYVDIYQPYVYIDDDHMLYLKLKYNIGG